MKIIITAFLLLLTISISAQSNFSPGYIVNNSSDTISGEINYSNWTYNPEKISFRSGGNTKEYSVQDLMAFAIDGQDQYVRHQVIYQLSAIEINEATEEFDFPEVKKLAWLRVLYKSDYTLLELNTPKRIYFFVDPKGQGLKELIYRIRVRNGEMQKDEQYKNLLQLYADAEEKGDKIRRMIDGAEYSSSAMMKIFAELNEGKSNFIKKRIPVQTDLMVAGGTYSFTPSGQPLMDGLGSYHIHTAEFKTTPAFKIGLGVTLSSQQNYGRFKSRAGLNIATLTLKGENNNSGNYQKEEYSGTVILVEPNFNFLISFNPQSKTQFLAGPYFGYNIGISNGVNSKFTNPGVVINKDNFPKINGFIVFALDAAVMSDFGKIGLQVGRVGNLLDAVHTQLKGTGVFLSYSFILKK